MASMYIDIVPNRRSPPAILLRESIREGGRVRKRTIANLSALPIEQAEMIRRVLKGEKLGPLESALEVVSSRHHGHVAAVLTAMRRLGFEKLVEAKPSHERDLVAAMVAERIIAPEASKLAMTRAWADTMLATSWASLIPTGTASTTGPPDSTVARNAGQRGISATASFQAPWPALLARRSVASAPWTA